MRKWPRWVKICLCLVLIVASAGFLIISKSPATSPEESLRQKEKISLIGPTNILETLELDLRYEDRLTVGESDYGYTLFSWGGTDWAAGDFLYFEKAGELTLFFPEYSNSDTYSQGQALPFFLFTDLACSHRAELTLAVDDNDGSKAYSLEAQIRPTGYFLFDLQELGISQEELEAALHHMSPYYTPDGTIVANVTVYDRAGNVIGTLYKDFTESRGR